MSVAQYGTTILGTATEVTVPETNDRPLQRLAMARHQQGISCLTLSLMIEPRDRAGATTGTRDSRPAAQRAVSLAEGLRCSPRRTARRSWRFAVSPVLERSQLVGLMKTTLAIREQARQESIRRMGRPCATNSSRLCRS